MPQFFEAVGNMHMHTPYSDGALYHDDIAQAALSAGLDFIVVTDHNVWVQGPDGYRTADDGRRVLVLIGEEVHDMTRAPQGNHLLVYGAGRELSRHAPDPQKLIDAVNAAGGLCFLAHPHEIAAPLFDEGDLGWVTWEVAGFTGIELWNYMSEFKSLLDSKAAAVRYAFNPELGICGPFPQTLRKWDELLSSGRRVVAIGGADAHGTTYTMGRLSRVIFPYEFLFGAINTHVLLEHELSGDADLDAGQIYRALSLGQCFVGYDQPHPSRGFRFSAQGERGSCIVGGEIVARAGVTLQVTAPARCDLRMIHGGQVVQRRDNGTNLTHITAEPGAYRVEASIEYKGQKRGWIYSNPIYVLAG